MLMRPTAAMPQTSACIVWVPCFAVLNATITITHFNVCIWNENLSWSDTLCDKMYYYLKCFNNESSIMIKRLTFLCIYLYITSIIALLPLHSRESHDIKYSRILIRFVSYRGIATRVWMIIQGFCYDRNGSTKLNRPLRKGEREAWGISFCICDHAQGINRVPQSSAKVALPIIAFVSARQINYTHPKLCMTSIIHVW